MKKRILAGISLSVMLLLLIFLGEIIHLPWGEEFPGPQPSPVWSREISPKTYISEGEGKLIIIQEESKGEEGEGEEGEGRGFVARSLDYYGKSLWEEKLEGSANSNFFFGKSHWAYIDSIEGHVSTFDYQGSKAGQFKREEKHDNVWLGPKGEHISISNYSPREEVPEKTLEGYYAEKLEVISPNGSSIYRDIFKGIGILDAKILSGQSGEDILILSKVEIYPQLTSKVALYDLEGNKITEQQGSELFLPPLIIKEGEAVVLASGREMFLYSLKDTDLLRREWDYNIDDCFLTPQGEIILVAGAREPFTENIQLLFIDSQGKVVWEKRLPGAYLQGRARQDGGIIIESSDRLFLLDSQGSSSSYYLIGEKEKIYLLSSDVFLSVTGTEIQAYQWQLPRR